MGRFRIRVSAPAKLALAVLATALVTAPVAVLASHQFADVPTGHPFHKEISAVADSGIAQGFDDGTYRPASNLTRQAMAAFLERGVGRAGYISDSTSVGNDAGLPTQAVAAEVGLDAGAAGAGSTGFVLLTGSLNASTDTPADCPCTLVVGLGVNAEGGDITRLTVPGEADETGIARASLTLQTVMAISGDQSKLYELIVQLQDADVGEVSVEGRLSALYVPLGPDGNDTTMYEHTCTVYENEADDPEPDPMPPSGCVFGSLWPASDADVFAISVGVGQTVTAETRSADGTGCSGDTNLTLSEFWGPLAVDDDSGIGPCSQIVQSGLAPGNYWIKVEPSTPSHSFDYRVMVTLSATKGGG